MGYVDLVDFEKKIGRSFTQKKCFNKWYKKGFLGRLDFMLVNVCVKWNVSAQVKDILRDTIDNSDWRVYVAKLISNWKDPMFEDDLEETMKHYMLLILHSGHPVVFGVLFVVWKQAFGKVLESKWQIHVSDLLALWQCVPMEIVI